MAQVLLKVGYRPVKIGWCVKNGDIDALRQAVRLTSTMWGGRFNPIIPVGDENEAASDLALAFGVDGLYSPTTDARTTEFAASLPYLKWPLDWDDLFLGNEKYASVLDIYHPLVHLRDAHKTARSHQGHGEALWIVWDEDTDPLRHVFACTFGELPPRSETEKDYEAVYKRCLEPRILDLTNAGEVPKSIMASEHISSISSLELEREFSTQNSNSHLYQPGVFIGDANSFTDLVAFWNLRASNLDLIFFDPKQSARLIPLCKEWLELASAGGGSEIADSPLIWLAGGRDASEASAITENLEVAYHRIPDDLWTRKTLMPARMTFGDSTMVGALESPDNEMLIQTPEPPFFRGAQFHFQFVVITVRFMSDLPNSTELSFRIPHFPELNEFVGRKCSDVYWKKCRIQSDGIDFVQHLSTEILYVSPIDQKELFIKVFEIFGIEAKQSIPGRTAARIIRQMGGIQGCRIFKIKGVRQLIKEHGPTDSFTRSYASELISNRDKQHKIHFEAYEDLFIGQGRQKLTHEFVFKKLLETDVFLVGLNLTCPVCELEFWLSMDALKKTVHCEYCAHSFNVTTQLRDRDWAYRTSGLFAKSSKQGAVPVVVTLQQLHAQFGMQMLGGWALFTTSMELSGKPIRKCESDLLVLGRDYHSRHFLVVGECKTDDEILDDDVQKLISVANAISDKKLTTYILFSKTGSFSDVEIERCKQAQISSYARVILLSGQELEPYYIYDNSPKEMELDKIQVSLNSMAAATSVMYFKFYPTLKHVPKSYPRGLYRGDRSSTIDVRKDPEQDSGESIITTPL